MKDIIIIPTFNRPEYLWLCLEHIVNTGEASTKHVRIYHDAHNHDSLSVRNDFAITADVVSKWEHCFATCKLVFRQPHSYIGNPFNFLEAYKEAYNDTEARYVYLIEDDVLVGQDFFRWHEAVQARGEYFCTVGWHCVRYEGAIKNDDPAQYIESTMDFSSIGVCWRREALEPFVRHATPLYYRDHRVYLAGAFPGSPINPGTWTEQAGIVTRLLHETKSRWVAWPTLRRCSHVGVSGYHRPRGHVFVGDIRERIAELRKAVADTCIVGMNRDFGGDIEPVLPAQPWQPEQLNVVQRFPYTGRI